MGESGTWACVYKASYDLKKILALFTVAVAVAFVLYAKQAGAGLEKKENESESKRKAAANYICQGI